MNFRVGQKVARVGGGAKVPTVNYPPLHKPCTVVNAYSDEGVPMIELLEYPNPKSETRCAGFRAQFFRLVVERKTNIDVFTAMLTPSPERVS